MENEVVDPRRTLQGSNTDRAVVAAIAEAVAARDIACELLNYRKDGSSFWNALFISPVHDETGELLFFFSSQLDVTDRRRREEADRRQIEDAVAARTQELSEALAAQTALLHELDHRVRNNLQLISALVLMECRSAAASGTAAELERHEGVIHEHYGIVILARVGDHHRHAGGPYRRRKRVALARRSVQPVCQSPVVSIVHRALHDLRKPSEFAT